MNKIDKLFKTIEFIQQKKITNTDKAGYVYLVFSGGRCKIGITKDPLKRIETFKVSSPFEVYVLCIRYFYDAIAVERLLHSFYKKFRKKGEWFELTRDQIFECCDLLEMGWFVGESERLEKGAKQAMIFDMF
jgi:hypothetical protein